jgi:hypothetical protein
MACDASVNPKWPETLTLLPGFENYNSIREENNGHLCLETPQLHHCSQEDTMLTYP